jgi:hypothetical protein
MELYLKEFPLKNFPKPLMNLKQAKGAPINLQKNNRSQVFVSYQPATVVTPRHLSILNQ